jgi:hypothetical protein
MASAIRPKPAVPNAGTRRQVELSTLRLLWTSCRQPGSWAGPSLTSVLPVIRPK